jgi:hypothetical protein
MNDLTISTNADSTETMGAEVILLGASHCRSQAEQRLLVLLGAH